MIITTSSVCSLFAALLLNRLPRIGMSPMPGIFCSDEETVLLSKPAMANVWPFSSSTSVSARRRAERGNAEPLEQNRVVEVERADLGPDVQLDAVADDFRREVQPDAELLELNADGEFEPEACATGIGNSPPARKLASLPSCATRFGSARLWNRPLDCSALMTPAEAVLEVEEEQVQIVAEHLAFAHHRLVLVEEGRRELTGRDAADRVLVAVAVPRGAELRHRVAAHFRETHRRSTWLLAPLGRICSSETTSSFFST